MGVEKVPVRSVGEPQALAKGIHDNCVSGNHSGTITLNTQWNVENLQILSRREVRGTGTKLFSATVHAAQHEHKS